MPALVTPLVLWPNATEGQLNPARTAAAAVTVLIRYFSKNVGAAMIGGAVTLLTLLYLLG